MIYRIIEGFENMNTDDVTRLLGTTYWAKDRTKEQIERSARNSACYGVVTADGDKLVGFARVVTDHATMYHLCDVVIDEEYRRKGMGTALVEYIENKPEYEGMYGVLKTRDAHRLYKKFGYEEISEGMMLKGR